MDGRDIAFVFGCIMGARWERDRAFDRRLRGEPDEYDKNEQFFREQDAKRASMMRLDDDIQVTRPGGAKGNG